MATVFAESDSGGLLSAMATCMYRAIARQDWKLVDSLVADHPAARDELAAWGLISDTGHRPAVRDPQQALEQKRTRELSDVRRQMDALAELPALARELNQHYQVVQLRAGTGSSVYLPDPAAVNARIQDVVGSARTEILAAQPGGPRSRELLELAVARDTKALDRGVELCTIYRDTVRDHAVTGEYARTMSARLPGRPAKYRTLVGDFERMIIVDRETAFVSDHIVAGPPAHSAWLVTDPAVVAVLTKVFREKWRRAQPWTGEMRVRTRGDAVVEIGPDGVRTDRRQRGIMRYLCAGQSQTATARKMGVSKRKLEEEVAVLKALWAVRTLNELIFQYALSPDRLVDDNAPDGCVGGEVEESAA